ncbi:TatD family hydrolase [Dysgonomonas sp. 25]|uniref:TatD family hydrolase n=1 Tax=Dysgonomonas sp. 25 TaxID=2302933 RepID=UPI0013D80160|nr:TatD family hydrolase [Dysgonomonas sp. 25]
MKLYDIHTHHLPTDMPQGYQVVSILNTYPLEADLQDKEGVYYSCGIHPWYMDKAAEQFQRLEEIALDRRVVAIGEAGLDKLKGAEWELQEHYFRKQIELSIEVQKPLIIHCVKAWDELIALRKEYQPDNAWIVHGFRGKPQQAEQLLHAGFKISVGEVFNPETIKRIPLDSLFCETDMSDTPVLSICQNVSRESDVCIEYLIENIGVNVKNAFNL